MIDTHCKEIAEECAFMLEQAADLILELKGQRYREEGVGPVGGLGEQVRHVVELFGSFLGGLEQGEVNYDDRPRNARLETDPAFAAEWLSEISLRLRDAAWQDKALRVCMDDAAGRTTDSSVARELRFLASHTVHHFAMIRILLVETGIRLPPSFGVAPATLRHRQALMDGKK